MKYALIKDTMKVVSIKEVEIDGLNLTITITSMKDGVYVETYTTLDEVLERLIGLNNGFNYVNIREWFNKTD